MRSRHAETFNHDAEAAGYDRDVQREEDPVRAGYGRLLDWVAQRSGIGPESVALELGGGTGNLSLRLPPMARLICVDVSAEMTRLARAKLKDRPEVEWVVGDLLEFFERAPLELDAVVSTYAIHHLEPDEKHELFRRIALALRPGGRFVVGDLMFADASERGEILRGYEEGGRAELAHDIEEEFFWDLATEGHRLETLGFALERRRFSTLSWGLCATRNART